MDREKYFFKKKIANKEKKFGIKIGFGEKQEQRQSTGKKSRKQVGRRNIKANIR